MFRGQFTRLLNVSTKVTLTFGGSYNETLTKATNPKGNVTLTTAARLAGFVGFDGCAESIELDGRSYDPTNNLETCDSFTSF